MRADSVSYAVSAARYLGIELSDQQITLLERFAEWLCTEATAAGGIGPNEQDRVWQRHIADSIVFGIGLAAGRRCIDVGSGIGLPGIPLAIVFPEIGFTLVDRAGRRCRLARRALAILGLDNCAVVEKDVSKIADTFDRLVSRASIPPEQLMFHVKHLLERPGVAVVGLSRQNTPHEVGHAGRGLRLSVVEVPATVLDSPASLLRIEAT